MIRQIYQKINMQVDFNAMYKITNAVERLSCNMIIKQEKIGSLFRWTDPHRFFCSSHIEKIVWWILLINTLCCHGEWLSLEGSSSDQLLRCDVVLEVGGTHCYEAEFSEDSVVTQEVTLVHLQVREYSYWMRIIKSLKHEKETRHSILGEQ